MIKELNFTLFLILKSYINNILIFLIRILNIKNKINNILIYLIKLLTLKIFHFKK